MQATTKMRTIRTKGTLCTPTMLTRIEQGNALEKDPVSRDWDERLQGRGNCCEYVDVLILERG
jgi:hypothetical protein